MKKYWKHIASISFCLILAIYMMGCSSTTKVKRLSGSEFLKQAKQTQLIGSFNWTTYIGSTKNRVYLEYGYMSPIRKGASTTIYWTPINELPAEIVEKLKSGEEIWPSPYK